MYNTSYIHVYNIEPDETFINCLNLIFINIMYTCIYIYIIKNVKCYQGAQKDKYINPSYQIREGEMVNIDVTSRGATLALGMMYFKTGNL